MLFLDGGVACVPPCPSHAMLSMLVSPCPPTGGEEITQLDKRLAKRGQKFYGKDEQTT